MSEHQSDEGSYRPEGICMETVYMRISYYAMNLESLDAIIIVGNFRGRNFCENDEREDFPEKTFADSCYRLDMSCTSIYTMFTKKSFADGPRSAIFVKATRYTVPVHTSKVSVFQT